MPDKEKKPGGESNPQKLFTSHLDADEMFKICLDVFCVRLNVSKPPALYEQLLRTAFELGCISWHYMIQSMHKRFKALNISDTDKNKLYNEKVDSAVRALNDAFVNLEKLAVEGDADSKGFQKVTESNDTRFPEDGFAA